MSYDTAEIVEAATATRIRAAGANGPYVDCGGATLIAGSAAASAEFFDGDPAVTGTLKHTLECETAGYTSNWEPQNRVSFPNGLWVEVTGDGAVCYVLFR